jgi:uncharacterized repeat protein (TIGR04042 family)
MPEMWFHVRWPDGEIETCYSPSLAVKDHLSVGASYALSDFLARSRTALTIASERVREKYGLSCSRALRQLSRIEEVAASFRASPDAQVTILSFEE